MPRPLAFALVLCLAACGPAPRPVPPTSAPEVGNDDLFRGAGVEGAFVLLDLDSGHLWQVNSPLCDRGFIPASTFKIPNTLIGLETGVIPNEDFALKWDGKKRWLASWNRDHDLASAMRESVVWFYQEIARRVGAARMQGYLDRFAYGNRTMGGPIDEFWLDGGIRITPRQQVEFLARLHRGELGVKPAHADLVRRLILRERRPGTTFAGKTGLGMRTEQMVGWLVGFVERGDRTFAYATLLVAPRADVDRVMPLREALTRQLLVRHGALPAEMELPVAARKP